MSPGRAEGVAAVGLSRKPRDPSSFVGFQLAVTLRKRNQAKVCCSFQRHRLHRACRSSNGSCGATVHGMELSPEVAAILHQLPCIWLYHRRSGLMRLCREEARELTPQVSIYFAKMRIYIKLPREDRQRIVDGTESSFALWGKHGLSVPSGLSLRSSCGPLKA